MTAVGRAQSVAEHWAELHRERLAWAHSAHRRFLATFDQRVRTCFIDHGEEASVVLFGRTQVGKTTLLLQLLGIAPAQADHVSRVLRGGRARGQSATATATQYERAPDESWRVIVDGRGGEPLDEDGVIAVLVGIRAAVEDGSFAAENPVTVAIPAPFFVPSTSDGPRVRILDLPGDNPVHPAEGRHVRAVAERYVPYADLILIVGRADDLSFLNPRAFSLPGIRDWRFTPWRFRVIATYSFSLQSLVQWVERHHALSAEGLRVRLMEQVATHEVELGAAARAPRLFFPLEFGQSWDDLSQRCPERHQAAAPIVAQLIEELSADIAASATPIGRIRQAASAHLVAARVKEECVRALTAERDALAHQAAAAGLAAEAARDLVVRARSELTLLPANPDRRDALRSLDFSALAEGGGEPGTNTKAFGACISEFCATLCKAALNFTPDLNARFSKGVANPIKADPSAVRLLVEQCFATLSHRLGDYWVDEYYPALSSDFDQDKAALREARGAAIAAVAAHVGARWTEAIVTKSRALDTERRSVAEKLAARGDAFSHALERQHELERRLADTSVDLANTVETMDADIERGRSFASFQMDACRDELRERKRRMATANSPTRRFVELLGAIAVCDERRKLFDE